jgi:beta-glucuronidase
MTKNQIIILLIIGLVFFNKTVYGGENAAAVASGQQGEKEFCPPEEAVPPAEPSELLKTKGSEIDSEEMIKKAWEASSKSDLESIDNIIRQAKDKLIKEVKQQQALLKGFPKRGDEQAYKTYNDYSTLLFIRGEILMNLSRKEEAIAQFKEIIDHYKWGQAWDPSRGSYWSVAEKSQDSIDVITGVANDNDHVPQKSLRTKPYLNTKGTEQIIDYTKYGKFTNVGTEQYKYSMADQEGLAKAVGEGIYPNESAIYENPRRDDLRKEGRLKGGHWEYINTDDLEAAYFKWATAPEPWGVKLFYLGMIFEKAEMYYDALKAYHALIVHFPETSAMTYWQTPWYPAQAAVAKIRHIIRFHPELNLDYKWMSVQVQNSFDNEVENDVTITYPGKIMTKGIVDKVKEKLNIEKCVLGKVNKRIGNGEVSLIQYENGHWQLLVKGEPYVIKGITYAPTKTGQSPDKGTLADWMTEDTNGNGKVDGPYDAWVDKNGNNVQDSDEPIVGDFALMKEMGVNTMRIYHNGKVINKELLRDMYHKYGIRVIVGDFLGKYAFDSGASWFEGTDYENPEHKKKMLESVKKMVLEHKDEPYVLFWLLGNENNYGVGCNADKKPEAYFRFVDEVAQFIKSLDKNHPVAISNGDTLFLDIFAKYSPNVDIYGANVYRGDYGFGSFWQQVAEATGRPAIITEYGCPAFAKHLTLEEAETAQAEYHNGNWSDIEENLAGRNRGVGHSLGGIAFEWMDEWWKNYEPFRHDRKSDAIGPFPGGYYFEEWFGLIGQGNGQNSPFLRHLRPVYHFYKKAWNKKLF